MDQAGTLRDISRKQMAGTEGQAEAGEKKRPRAIAVASGKGGVGKTNIVSNTAVALARRGKKVLVFDADIGLGNIHILLGLVPKYNLLNLLNGEMEIGDIVIDGPCGISILPAGSGGNRYHGLSRDERLLLKAELETFQERYDFIFFDIGAGISENVLYFCTVAQEILIVSSAEPTSFADAYAIMKVLSRDYARKKFRLVINMVESEKEGVSVFSKLSRVADRFNLDISIDFLGHIVRDDKFSKCVIAQKLFLEEHPGTEAGRCIESIAGNIISINTVEEIAWNRAFNL